MAQVAGTQGADTIAALYPYDVALGVRSGRHPGKTISLAGQTAYSTGAFFQGEDVTFTTIEELHVHLERLAAEGQAFVVRSQRKPGLQYLRRTANRSGKAPPGLARVDLRVLPLDLDRVPNVLGFDPRVDPDAAWRWLVSLLGPEFSTVSVSAAWSSSCCYGVPQGQAPEHLDARLWVMLDTRIGAERAKQVMQFLGTRTTAYFAERGIRLEKTSARTGRTRPYQVVDWKISEVQQPIYVAAPRFLDGLIDDLPARSSLIKGEHGEVSYADLQAAMLAAHPGCADTGHAGKQKPAKQRQAAKAPRIAKGRVRIPCRVVPFAASACLVEDQRNLLEDAIKGRGAEGYRSSCVNLYHRRLALEMTALAVHRGGLVEGERDECCTRIASALVASYPLGWSRDRVRAEVRQVLALVVDQEWLEVEWETAAADTSILDRYRRASLGQKAPHGRDLRYSYGKARLVEDWNLSLEEIAELGLRSLCTPAEGKVVERDARRVDAGGLNRADWLDVARAQAPDTHRLRAEGASLRSIATRLDLSIGKVQRLLALPLAEVDLIKQIASTMPIVGAPAPAPTPTAVEAADTLERAIRYAQASTGADTPAEIARILCEPVGLIEHVVAEMALLQEQPTRRANVEMPEFRMAA